MDNNSTTRLYDKVIKNMICILQHHYANPSTSYKIGHDARIIINKARKSIAKILDIPNLCNLIFTSGASESNNNMIRGYLLRCNTRKSKPKILCSTIEHSSIYETCILLNKLGLCELEFIPVDTNGFINQQIYENMIDNNTKLVCIMLGNNEIGTIQNIKKLLSILKNKNPDSFFLCDATQIIGKYKISFKNLDVDGISFSAHKFHGPKGIGCMYLKDLNSILSCNTGGSQEYNLRAGTENTASIFGMALALKISYNKINENIKKIKYYRDYMENKLLKYIPNAVINCPINDINKRMYSVLNITLPTTVNILNILNNYNIYINVGSACNKGKQSRVLSAIGLTDEQIKSTIRISLSTFNTIEECDYVVNKIIEII